MEKMLMSFGLVLLSSTVFAAEAKLDLSNLKNENLVGVTMHSFEGVTVEFKETGFIENAVTEDDVQTTCSGKYSIVKSLLGTRARTGEVFLHFTERKCSVSESQNIVSYYVELPQKIVLGDEIPVIEGGLDYESKGRIKKRKSLIGTGDHNSVTFSK